MTRFALLLAPLLLAACAATTAMLSPEQCRADWGAVGYSDGREGAAEAKLLSYREACARGGRALTAAEEADWQEGWRTAREDAGLSRHADIHAPRARSYPRVYPSLGVGVGSGGVSVGAGLGVGLGSFGLGLYF